MLYRSMTSSSIIGVLRLRGLRPITLSPKPGATVYGVFVRIVGAICLVNIIVAIQVLLACLVRPHKDHA